MNNEADDDLIDGDAATRDAEAAEARARAQLADLFARLTAERFDGSWWTRGSRW
jgi:hypothetical protein